MSYFFNMRLKCVKFSKVTAIKFNPGESEVFMFHNYVIFFHSSEKNIHAIRKVDKVVVAR